MSFQITYPRQVLERVSDRKKRKLAIDDDSDEIYSDRNLDIFIDSELEVVEDSQTSLKGHRDLFGDLIPYNTVKNVEAKNKSIRKTPVSRKKKQPCQETTNDPIIRPKRVFIPTPKIMKLMQEAQIELHSLMGTQTSSSDVSVLTTDDLNVSGIQNLQDSPSTNIINESNTNANNDDSNSRPILEGVVGFVDYKIENDRSGSSIIQRLIDLGAKVEKTFNRKVTHVVFCDGYRSTYNKAIERNIPLVSARWIECSALANKMLDHVNYPPVGVEKYKEPPKIKYLDIPENHEYKKYLRPSNAVRDQLFKETCDNLMERFHNFNVQQNDISENSIIETPKRTTVNQIDKPCKNNMLNVLSDQLYTVLNKSDSPVPDDEIDELCIPMSIKELRKYLTPSEKENTTLTEINSELAKIEDRLNLNSQARKRFRKLLFPSGKDSNNISNISDFPSPSPQKLRISAPSRLISTRKKKIVIDNKLLPNTNKLDNNNKTPPEKNVQRNHLKWEIPSDLRSKKVRKPTVQKVKSVKKTQSQDTTSSMISRNSSKFFLTPKASLASPVVLTSIACTGMLKSEVDILKSSILHLGYNFHAKVEPLTTYLITKSQPYRTLNIVFGMAYGCFIVSEDWVHESFKVGRWLSHKKYLISDLSEPVKEFQIRRHTFGSMLTFHIFDNIGRIYISDTCETSAKHLRKLVRACGGHCTSTETKADVIVGYTQQMNNNVHEKWILDCITQGTLLNKFQYMLTNTNKQ